MRLQTRACEGDAPMRRAQGRGRLRPQAPPLGVHRPESIILGAHIFSLLPERSKKLLHGGDLRACPFLKPVSAPKTPQAFSAGHQNAQVHGGRADVPPGYTESAAAVSDSNRYALEPARSKNCPSELWTHWFPAIQSAAGYVMRSITCRVNYLRPRKSRAGFIALLFGLPIT